MLSFSSRNLVLPSNAHSISTPCSTTTFREACVRPDQPAHYPQVLLLLKFCTRKFSFFLIRQNNFWRLNKAQVEIRRLCAAEVRILSMWDLWWTKWLCGRFPSQEFCSSSHSSFHKYPKLIWTGNDTLGPCEAAVTWESLHSYHRS
jgi:hypothetical protein